MMGDATQVNARGPMLPGDQLPKAFVPPRRARSASGERKNKPCIMVRMTVEQRASLNRKASLQGLSLQRYCEVLLGLRSVEMERRTPESEGAYDG